MKKGNEWLTTKQAKQNNKEIKKIQNQIDLLFKGSHDFDYHEKNRTKTYKKYMDLSRKQQDIKDKEYIQYNNFIYKDLYERYGKERVRDIEHRQMTLQGMAVLASFIGVGVGIHMLKKL